MYSEGGRGGTRRPGACQRVHRPPVSMRLAATGGTARLGQRDRRQGRPEMHTDSLVRTGKMGETETETETKQKLTLVDLVAVDGKENLEPKDGVLDARGGIPLALVHLGCRETCSSGITW